MMIPNLWSRSRRTSGSSRPPVVSASTSAPVTAPFIPPPYVPSGVAQDPRPPSNSRHRQRPVAQKYESDSEIPSNRRVYASAHPVIPTSITPHPGERPGGRGARSGRRGSESSDASAGSGQRLRSCLKPTTAYPTIAHNNPPPNALTSLQPSGLAPGWTPAMVANPRPEHVYVPPGMVQPSAAHHLSQSQDPKLSNSAAAYPSGHYSQAPAPTPFVPPAPIDGHRRTRRESAPVGYKDLSRATQRGPARAPMRRGSSASESSNEPAPAVARPSRGLDPNGPIPKVGLHWMLLNRFRDDRRTPTLYFDVAFDPSKMHNLMGWVFDPQLGREKLDPVPPLYAEQLAFTEFSVPQMIIHCPRGALGPSPIMIENLNGIKVKDVFKHLWNTYNRIVSAEDMLKLSEREKARCVRHFKKRCEDVPWETEVEERLGMRYVDLLRGSRRRIFKGITQRPSQTGISFQLHFDDAD